MGYSAALMLPTAWQGIRGLNTILYLLQRLWKGLGMCRGERWEKCMLQAASAPKGIH